MTTEELGVSVGTRHRRQRWWKDSKGSICGEVKWKGRRKQESVDMGVVLMEMIKRQRIEREGCGG